MFIYQQVQYKVGLHVIYIYIYIYKTAYYIFCSLFLVFVLLSAASEEIFAFC